MVLITALCALILLLYIAWGDISIHTRKDLFSLTEKLKAGFSIISLGVG